MSECLEVFLNVDIMIIFHIVANLMFFFGFDSDVTHDQLLSVMQTPDWEILLRKQISWIHGPADLARGGAIHVPPLTRVFLHLPTSDIYVSAVTCVNVFVRTRLAILLYMFLFSLTKNTWPQRAGPAVACSVHIPAAVGERSVCESIPKWLTAHLCVCTLL